MPEDARTADRVIVRDGDADTALVAEYESTRREAVRRGLAFGGTVLAAAAVAPLLGVRNAFAQADGDQAILSAAIRLENTAVAAYDAAARSGRLDAATTRVVQLFRRHEEEHAERWSAALRERGGTPPDGTDRELLQPLASLEDQAAIARFAIELETMALAAYYDAHGRLKDTRLLQVGTSIMANEGQHLVVLRQALNRPPFPNAFETGQARGA